MVVQGDTMDRNPVVVDPHNVQNIKVEQNLQHLGNQVVQQVGQQQPQQIVQEYVVQQPQGYDPWVDGLQLLHEQPSPTGFDLCYDNMPGDLDFSVSFDKMTTGGKNKYWDVSSIF